jgi:hypothetical protein
MAKPVHRVLMAAGVLCDPLFVAESARHAGHDTASWAAMASRRDRCIGVSVYPCIGRSRIGRSYGAKAVFLQMTRCTDP